MPSTNPSRQLLWLLLLILLIIVLLLLRHCRGPEPGPEPPTEGPASEAHYASGWTVKNNADWTPPPPSGNPLGPPNDTCTGGTIANSWARFTFPAANLPPGATVTGVEVRLKYLSPSGSNTVQLTRGGAPVGASKTVASVSGASNCAATTFTGVGGDGDTWGSGVSAADVNAGDIGVQLTQNANTVDLDAIELKVFYTP